jgi:hypothetical protein
MNNHFINTPIASSNDATLASKQSFHESPHGPRPLPLKKRPIRSCYPSCDNSAGLLLKKARTSKSLGGFLSPHECPNLPLKKRPVVSSSCSMANIALKKTRTSKSLGAFSSHGRTSLPLKKRPIRSLHPSCGMDNDGAASLLLKKAPKSLVAKNGVPKTIAIPPVTPDTNMIVKNVHKDDESVPQRLQFALVS